MSVEKRRNEVLRAKVGGGCDRASRYRTRMYPSRGRRSSPARQRRAAAWMLWAVRSLAGGFRRRLSLCHSPFLWYDQCRRSHLPHHFQLLRLLQQHQQLVSHQLLSYRQPSALPTSRRC